MGLCSAIRPKHEPFHGSAQGPDSLNSVVRKDEEDQGHRASCDEACGDKMTFEKMQTRMHNSSGANACALMKCRAHEKNERLWCVR